MSTFKHSTFLRVMALALTVASLAPNLAKADEAAQLTKGVKLSRTVDPIYPVKLGNLGISEGSATIIVSVDNTGKMMDWIALSASQPEFIAAISNVINEWEFTPARYNGMPIASTITINFQFKNDVVTMNFNIMQMTNAFLNRNINNAEKSLVACYSELDKLPEPTNIVQPIIDPSIPFTAREGEVVIGFFIDANGKVRLPMMMECKGDPRLADAAYDALNKWEFARPLVNGKPTMVRASQKFIFKRPAK